MEHDEDLGHSEDFETKLDEFNPESAEGNLNHPPFPPLDVLLLFSELSYLSHKDLVNKVLPGNWRLLTTAYNTKSGYHGVAFWNPEMQLVSVAHRGTDSLKAVGVDIKGVTLNKYTKYMASAITFVNQIISHLNKINLDPEICFRLSLTGHSLGGYLAQVTAFTARYNIRLKGDQNEHQDSKKMLVHTRVFDSPGCKEMLVKIKDDYGKRYDSSMSVEKLDIEGYFIAANLVNTHNLHVGRLFMIDQDRVSNFINDWFTNSVVSNITMHYLDNFKKALSEPNVVVKQVLDWPSGFNEKRKLTYRETKYSSFDPKNCDNVHLNTKPFFGEHRSFSVFSGEELRFLDVWRSYVNGNCKIPKIDDLKMGISVNYEIDEERRVIECPNATGMDKLVREIKKLFRWLPHQVKMILKEIKLRSPILLYQSFDRIYRRQLARLYCDCKDTLGLGDFLGEECDNKLLYIETECTKFESSRIINILSQIKDLEYVLNDCTFLCWDNFLDLTRDFEVAKLHKSEDFTRDSLLVIDCSSMFKNQTKIISDFFRSMPPKNQKKVIFIFPKELEISKEMTYVKSSCNFVLDDLTEDSRADVSSRVRVVLGDTTYNIKEFLGLTNDFMYTEGNMSTFLNRILRKLVLEREEYKIKLKNTISSLDTNGHYLRVEKDVPEERVKALLGRNDVMIFLSGEPNNLKGPNLTFAGDDEERDFRKTCHNVSTKTVFWLDYQSEKLTVKYIYSNALYLMRNFHTRAKIDTENIYKTRDKITEKFVIQVANNVESIPASLKNRINIISDEKSTKTGDNIHFLLYDGSNLFWKRSIGSLDALRPYVTVDKFHSVEESELLSDHKRVSIIAGEPGMGKSTTLTSLESTWVNEKSLWVFRINLKNVEEQIKRLPDKLDKTSVINFLIPDKDNNVERDLLMLCLESSTVKNVVLFFDGYDEIADDTESEIKYSETILKLFYYIKYNTTAMMTITSRIYKKECLEDRLSEFATIFETIEEGRQRQYLKIFWYNHLILEWEKPDDGWLEDCVQELYRNAKSVIGQDIESLMGIPLQLRMLAEVFLPQIQNRDSLETLKFESLNDLYRQFVNNRLKIYEQQKCKAKTQLQISLHNTFMAIHRKLAFLTLYPESGNTVFTPYTKDGDNWEEVNEMNRIGIVQTTSNGYDFLHRTFAEFFLADLLFQWLQQKDGYKHLPIVDAFLEKFLLRLDFKLVRLFLEKLIPSVTFSFSIKKMSLDENPKTILHTAVLEKNKNIFNLIMKNLDLSQPPDSFHIATLDRTGRTTLYLTVETCDPHFIDPLIGMIKKFTEGYQSRILLRTMFKYINKADKINKDLRRGTLLSETDSRLSAWAPIHDSSRKEPHLGYHFFSHVENFFNNKYILEIKNLAIKETLFLLNEMDGYMTEIEQPGDENMFKKYLLLEKYIQKQYNPKRIHEDRQTIMNVDVDTGCMELINSFNLNADDLILKIPLVYVVITFLQGDNKKSVLWKKTFNIIQHFSKCGASVRMIALENCRLLFFNC